MAHVDNPFLTGKIILLKARQGLTFHGRLREPITEELTSIKVFEERVETDLSTQYVPYLNMNVMMNRFQCNGLI
jgi:hypothetical protein